MKRMFILCSLVVLTSIAFAETTWTGYIVDKMCSKRVTDATKAGSHSKECLIEEHCAQSGYGILLDGKWYRFNKKGDELAAAFLSHKSQEKGIKITVTGTMKKDKINVTTISEAN